MQRMQIQTNEVFPAAASSDVRTRRILQDSWAAMATDPEGVQRPEEGPGRLPGSLPGENVLIVF